MLLKTEEELRKYVTVGRALKLPTLTPAINAIEQNEVQPILGDALYNSLSQGYDNNFATDTTGALAKLLPYAQQIIAGLAVADTLDISQVNITESGITRTERDDEKTAYHYQKLEAQSYLRRIGYNAQEALLAFLEANIADYADWKSSEAYKAAKRYFITSASEFSHYFNINNSRLTYRSMMYLMERAEQFQIRETVGDVLFEELKAQDNAAGLSENNKLLMPYIKPAIAYLTIADAALELSLAVTPQGLQLTQLQAEGGGRTQQQPADNQLEILRTRAESTGQQYLHKLREYLLKNASEEKYQAFYNSDLFPKTDTQSGPRQERTPARRIYGGF